MKRGRSTGSCGGISHQQIGPPSRLRWSGPARCPTGEDRHPIIIYDGYTNVIERTMRPAKIIDKKICPSWASWQPRILVPDESLEPGGDDEERAIEFGTQFD